MSERAAFINAILDNPADDTARLVFADWLEEHGEPERGEFIRCQIAAARLPEGGRGSPQAARAAALSGAHQAAWRAALGVRGYEGGYERGFLADLGLAVHEFTARAPSILAREPAGITLELISCLDDDGEVPIPLDWVRDFAAQPLLRAVTKITSQSGGFGVRRFAELMKAPHLMNLRAIEIFEDHLGAEGLRAIASAPAAFTLEALDLNSAIQHYYGGETRAGVDAVKVLATAPRFASLKFLGLPFNCLGDRSVRALLASKTLPGTMRLVLDENEFDEEQFEEQLADRFRFGCDEDED